MTKGNGRGIALVVAIIFIIFCAVSAILYYLPGFSFSDDEVFNDLIGGVLIRTFAAAFLIVVYALNKESVAQYPRRFDPKRFFKMIPCLLVAIVNFPFFALICGSAAIIRYDLLWIFCIDCLFIAITEEIFFRGIIETIFARAFCGKKYAYILTMVMTSATFALWHLFNLFSDGVGETLAQVGYTFLLGMMFSFMKEKSGGLIYPIVAHALFDVGGRIVPFIGSGTFQDGVFYIMTVSAGVLCGAYVCVCILIKQNKKIFPKTTKNKQL